MLAGANIPDISPPPAFAGEGNDTNTKDSSSDKSQDSGIDSIEKPGKDHAL